MYDELVNRLRELHPEGFGNQWDFAFACQQAMHEAADGIEDLIKKLNHADEQIEKLVEVAEERCWIPVSERLPDDNVFVLVCNDEGRMMIARHESETYEWYYKYTNYDIDIWDNAEQGPVQCWMPLPEPPKEET